MLTRDRCNFTWVGPTYAWQLSLWLLLQPLLIINISMNIEQFGEAIDGEITILLFPGGFH